MKKPFLVLIPLLLFSFLFSQLILQTGCASIVPPEGGPRDSLPPRLTRATPVNETKNFADDKIVLSFDEYVDIENAQQNMIVSPLPKNMPTVTRKLNTITIKLRDSLERNTTYSLNFGKTIKDINEGNVMQDFTYLFSTGAYMDSLRLFGRVIDAETGESDSTMTIMLHTNPDDSAVIKERPRYIAKTNGAGQFHFEHLSPGTFYIYALKDEGGSYRYMSNTAAFAFADSSVTSGAQTDSIILYSFVAKKEDAAAPPVAPPTTGGNRNRQTSADKRLKFTANLDKGRLGMIDSFMLTFEHPLRTFDSSKIHLTTDTLYTPVTGYHWKLDSLKRKAVLQNTWKENTSYHLIMEKEFATDTLGQQLLKSDTLDFLTNSAADYGKVSLRLRNLDKYTNPVLLFIQSDRIIGSYPVKSEYFSQPFFEPGEYNIRVLNDLNKNGKWDPGEFFGKRKQPEIVQPISRKITVRVNWDDIIEIAL